MFSKFFINRPIFATVLALLIVVAGLVTLGILPIAQYPDITPPTVQVSAVYPGANAQTVAQTVGIPIEQQVNGVEGMLYMSSNSSSSGCLFAHHYFCRRNRYRHGNRTSPKPCQRGTGFIANPGSGTGSNRSKAVVEHRDVPHHDFRKQGI